VRKKDLNIIGIILSYVRNWENCLFSQIEFDIYNTFSNNDLNIIENTVKHLPWDFINSPVINYNNEPDYQNIVKLINQITINPPNQFIELIKSCFQAKIDKDNDKDEDNDNDKDKDKDKDKEKKNPKKQIAKDGKIGIVKGNIIPSSYIDTAVIDVYIKKQFEIHYKKKLEEQKKIDPDKKFESELINPVTQLGSQVVQQIIKKVDKMYQSFFALKKNPPKHMNKDKISPPHYLKNERFVLIFQKDRKSVV
jgi:hypothetical protein